MGLKIKAPENGQKRNLKVSKLKEEIKTNENIEFKSAKEFKEVI